MPARSSKLLDPRSLRSDPLFRAALAPPLLLTPRILLYPAPSDPSDPSSPRLLRWPEFSYSLRYQVEQEAGVPVRCTIPEQQLGPDLPLPRQSFRFLSTFHKGHGDCTLRRLWFRCPGPRCSHHRAASLYLYHSTPAALARSSSCFWCCRCFDRDPSLPRPPSIPEAVYRVARDPLSDYAAAAPLSIQLRALPLWLRWRAGGKRAKRERGIGPELPVRVPSSSSLPLA